jgi:hypothetical protein
VKEGDIQLSAPFLGWASISLYPSLHMFEFFLKVFHAKAYDGSLPLFSIKRAIVPWGRRFQKFNLCLAHHKKGVLTFGRLLLDIIAFQPRLSRKRQPIRPV